jgi:hypothetical protein
VAAQELLPARLTVPLRGRPATTEMNLGFLASVQLSIVISQPRSYVFKQIQFLDTTTLPPLLENNDQPMKVSDS